MLHPDAFDGTDADLLYTRLLAEEPWEEHRLVMFGRAVSEPRRSVWHADDALTYTYSGRRREVRAWTPLLESIKGRCEELARHRFNGALVNLYRDGQDHMGWHADDEANLGPTPVIASVSLGAERRFDFRHRTTKESVRIVLPHGSILVMSGETQARWVHRIPRETRVAAPRINLTFRHLLWGS